MQVITVQKAKTLSFPVFLKISTCAFEDSHHNICV